MRRTVARSKRRLAFSSPSVVMANSTRPARSCGGSAFCTITVRSMAVPMASSSAVEPPGRYWARVSGGTASSGSRSYSGSTA